MGSYRKAIMTGFICRLCSEQQKNVIHFYSKRAKELDLIEKMKLLPITVRKYDNLPKTICEACIERLQLQYNLTQKVRKNTAIAKNHRRHHRHGRCPVECPLNRLQHRRNSSNASAEESVDSTSSAGAEPAEDMPPPTATPTENIPPATQELTQNIPPEPEASASENDDVSISQNS